MGPRFVQALRRLAAFDLARRQPCPALSPPPPPPHGSLWCQGNLRLVQLYTTATTSSPSPAPAPAPVWADSSTNSHNAHHREAVPPPSHAATGLDHRTMIYCNRALNMRSISAVGFDLDYTLAQYRPETFELLAYQATAKKLVYNLGYPRQILDWKFDWKYMVRGLVLDKRRGNILKMDRHKYVKVAYHGFQELSREERTAAYGNTLSRDSYDEPDYALIDTLFSLAEAHLFAQLVELKDTDPELFPSQPEYYTCFLDNYMQILLFPSCRVYCENDVPVVPTYAEIYKDVRAAVDLCHRDGTLKQAVADDPSKYIYADEQLISMLKMLRESGRLTFLVTNSLWDYTHVVMNFLFSADKNWLDYFDLVITGSAKPSFFMDGNQAPLFAVDVKTGMLHNTDNGTPVPQIGLIPLSTTRQASKVYQGGTVSHLHKLLAIDAGAQVLYCGDHIYGDILRSKKQLGWRTMLVVPELDREVELLQSSRAVQKEIQRLRHSREEIEDELQKLEWTLKYFKGTKEEEGPLQEKREALQRERDEVQKSHRTMQRKFHEQFHKTWGQLMKAGHQTSRFAHQVERFACLYTSQVTNLSCYSPEKCFRTAEDFMPHELRDEFTGQLINLECTR
ncbi:5'-nucleotidase domain-containing protein 4 isoform X2 [Selaginella moellendorffii]|uniref:5'-nucleotidase domain-containing protein 4 isoform X2 n=1 Tax=Selaginella moellendorffii TaxID=88036 RepID=UPI000D1C768F|nr:5'-nucleotidase domain-containing protein 4 isoform X2 [Selaginella moellendorffii]|eukprot:XP_024541638.1 5'-nucleotidase domain-containing protein 4 isoform X2 [Selaginella moellendorffii]